MPRSKAQELVRALGAETSETVSRKVTTLVAGSAAGSKMARARQLGIEILDEQQFLSSLGRGPEKTGTGGIMATIIDKETLEHVASLARLEITPEEEGPLLGTSNASSGMSRS